MARVIIDYHFAPIPLDAIGDSSLPSPVFELYCLLRKLGFQRREFTIRELCTMLAKADSDHPELPPRAPAQRSVYRWLTALEAAGWLTWHRRGNDQDRFLPHNQKHVTPESHDEPDVTLVSHACVTRVTSQVTPESHGDRVLARPDAPKNRTKNPERILQDHDLPPPPCVEPPTAAPGGGGGGSVSDHERPTATPDTVPDAPIHAESVRLLRQAGLTNAKTVAACARLAPNRVRAIIDQAQATGLGPGGIARNCRDELAASPEVRQLLQEDSSDATPDRPPSGPPPGVRTITPEQAVAWGLVNPDGSARPRRPSLMPPLRDAAGHDPAPDPAPAARDRPG